MSRHASAKHALAKHRSTKERSAKHGSATERSAKLAAKNQRAQSKHRRAINEDKKRNSPSAGATTSPGNIPRDSGRLPADVVSNLRALAHGLSNSLETILQAAYLLDQSKLDPNGKRWTQLIDTAAQDATRTNREIREILRSQS